MTSDLIDSLQVYAGVFPIDAGEFPKLEEAIERVRPISLNMDALLTAQLTLNDRSGTKNSLLTAKRNANTSVVTIQRESSAALSQGFRLGFLGTLHMDVLYVTLPLPTIRRVEN